MRRKASVIAALAALFAALGAAQAQGAKEFAFDFCANPSGTGALGGECRSPRGIAVNEAGVGGVPAGTVYVADLGNRRIQSFGPDGTFIRAWGKDVIAPGQPADTGEGFEVCEAASECKRGQSGSAAGEFDDIAGGIAVNQSTGDVYVVDRDNFRIQQFSAAGGFVRTWGRDVDSTGGSGFEVCEAAADCKAGAAGEGAGMFGFGVTGALAGIAVDEAGDVYVSDAGNARVQKFDSEGGFLRMGGWDVNAVGLETEYEVCAIATECKGGTVGSGEGQFSDQNPNHLAVDADGEVYVVDSADEKVVRLDSDLGLVKDDFAPEALEGATPRAIAVDWASGNAYLAVGDQIRVIDPESEEEAANPVDTEPGGAVISNWFGLAIDSASGWMFAACGDPDCDDAIRAFEPVERLEARTRPAQEVTAEAATLHGEVKPEGEPLSECGFEYDTAPYAKGDGPHGELAPCAEYEAEGAWQPLGSPAELGTGAEFVAVRANVAGLHPGTVYHFRLVAENERPEAEGEGGPERVVGEDAAFQSLGPVISASFSRGVGETEATLVADVDPEGKATTYRFEYGTEGPCSDPENACTAVPLPDGVVGSDSETHRVVETLEGLAPGTTYHFRAVATDSEGVVNEGPDRAFTTYLPLGAQSCPNEDLRSGTPSTELPDCRAYEMVSPPDKGGGDIAVGGAEGQGFEAAYRQASLGGERLTYSSSTPFGDSLRGARSNQYLSGRNAGGWSTHALLPAQGTTVFDPGFNLAYDLGTNFQAFTPDLCQATMRDHNEEPLAPDAIEDFTNLYLRDNCGPGADTYQALSVGASAEFADVDIVPRGRVYSQDLEHVVFGAAARLEATPPPAENNSRQIYDAVRGPAGRVLRLVSVLPGGEADTERSDVGPRSGEIRGADLSRAVATDGSRVFWSSGSGGGFAYVRANPGAEQSELANGGASGAGTLSAGSEDVTDLTTETGEFEAGQTIYGTGIPRGTTIAAVGPTTLTLSAVAGEDAASPDLVATSECLEPAKACTAPVTSGGGDTTFWTADPSGSAAIYGEDGGLYLLDVEAALAGEDANAVTEIAADAGGLVGTAEDLSRIYFTSTEELAAGAAEGERNVYLREGGAVRLIATLAPAEEEANQYAIDRGGPPSRVSPDGRVLAFMSNSAKLAEAVAGHDNADAATGRASYQLYRYDAAAAGGEGELLCVSCNPSGARPEAQTLLRPYTAIGQPAFCIPDCFAAAWLPTCEWSNHCKRSLTDDGNRLFFNAFDPLVPEDRNDAQDVYQWQAPGTGSCTKADPRYFEQNGGCIHLISTGKSKENSELTDASASGNDVFFTTDSDIAPQDLAFIDVYDARVNGGFPPPEPEAAACVGDACQSVPPAPEAPSSASEAYAGPGNPAPAGRSRCAGSARRAKALARKARRARRAAKRSESPRRTRRLRRRARALAGKAGRQSRKAKRCRRGRASR